MPSPPEAWRLIAVLQSTFSLSSELALRLYSAAVSLELEQRGIEQIAGDLGMGQVRRLGRELLLGVLGGPGFEAELDTPTGKGFVRFIVTKEGIELARGHDESNDAFSARSRGAKQPPVWN